MNLPASIMSWTDIQVRLDAFTQVKKAIDDMIEGLLKVIDYVIKHKDFCTDQFNQNQLQTVKKGREKFDLIAKSDDLEISIKTLTDVIKGPRTEIPGIQVQLKHADEDCEQDYKELQITVADQLETQ